MAQEAPQGGTTVTGTTGQCRSTLIARVWLVPILFAALAVIMYQAVAGHLGHFAFLAVFQAVVGLGMWSYLEVASPVSYERSTAEVCEFVASLLEAEASPVNVMVPELPIQP